MPTLGWARREWRFPILCVRCRLMIREGITHVSDRDDPPNNALCERCYGLILRSSPDEPDVNPAAQ